MKIKKNILAIIAVAISVLAVVFLFNRDGLGDSKVEDLPSRQKYSANIGSLSPVNFSAGLDREGVVLIDIRTKEEFDAGHISGAIQSDYYKTASFMSFLNSLDKEGDYLIYCHSGNRSGSTLDLMKELGFQSVHDLNGGISAWEIWGGSVVTCKNGIC